MEQLLYTSETTVNFKKQKNATKKCFKHRIIFLENMYTFYLFYKIVAINTFNLEVSFFVGETVLESFKIHSLLRDVPLGLF